MVLDWLSAAYFTQKKINSPWRDDIWYCHTLMMEFVEAVRLLHRSARIVPDSVLLPSLALANRFAIQKAARENGFVNEEFLPTDRISPDLRRRIDEAGGLDRLNERARRHAEMMDAATLTALLHDKTWDRKVNVTGGEFLEKPSPHLIACPHVGPFGLVLAHAFRTDRKLALFSSLPKEVVDIYIDTFAATTPGWNRNNFLHLDATSVGSLARARTAIGQNFDLVWQPDVAMPAKDKRKVDINFLGYPTSVSSAMIQFARMKGLDVVLASAAVKSYRPIDMDIDFVPIKTEKEVADDEVIRSLYGHVEGLVLQNLEQWTLWKRPTHGLGISTVA